MSPQTLSEADRRLVAAWAAAWAERVLWVFEAESPADGRPRAAIARTRAFARGELDTAGEIRRRFADGGATRDATSPAAARAARAAGQAAAVCHMGAHALGAAAYAVRAAALAEPAGGRHRRDRLAARPHDAGGSRRSANPSGCRQGPVRPALAGASRVGSTRQDHPGA